MAFLAASLMACLVGANYFLHRDVMYPGFLQASLWFVAVSLILLNEQMFIPVSDGVFVLLVAGVVPKGRRCRRAGGRGGVKEGTGV